MIIKSHIYAVNNYVALSVVKNLFKNFKMKYILTWKFQAEIYLRMKRESDF